MVSKAVEKIIACFAVFALVLAVVAAIYPLYKHSPRWVQIQDPNRLLDECGQLLAGPEALSVIRESTEEQRSRGLPEKTWPSSVRNLRPVAVYATSDCILIHLHGGGPKPARGYLVYPDGRSKTVAPPGLVLHGCVDAGIFRYRTAE